MTRNQRCISMRSELQGRYLAICNQDYIHEQERVSVFLYDQSYKVGTQLFVNNTIYMNKKVQVISERSELQGRYRTIFVQYCMNKKVQVYFYAIRVTRYLGTEVFVYNIVQTRQCKCISMRSELQVRYLAFCIQNIIHDEKVLVYFYTIRATKQVPSCLCTIFHKRKLKDSVCVLLKFFAMMITVARQIPSSLYTIGRYNFFQYVQYEQDFVFLCDDGTFEMKQQYIVSV